MRRALLAALLIPVALDAQRPRGTITGTVRDSSRNPIPDADVFVIPGRKSVRTDSAGRYTIADLGNDAYTVRARKLGWAPEVWEVRINAAGTVTTDFTLRRRTDLDTVRVTARRTCDGLMVTNFECRREISEARGALFMDFPEIDAWDEREVARLFSHIPGMPFSPNMRYWSPPREDGTRFKCILPYVDGREPGPINPIPRFTKDLVSLEIYPNIDSVPVTNRKDLRLFRQDRVAGSRCGVVMYWTVYAPVEKPRSKKIAAR